MRVCVNGKEIEIGERLTVAELVAERGLNPALVVVEHNLVILPKDEWPGLELSAGDKLEIVAFMGGG